MRRTRAQVTLVALVTFFTMLALPGLARPTAASLPAVAFFYGSELPWTELAAFDWVVVEPELAGPPPTDTAARTEVFAYISVGEVHPTRSWFAAVPDSWRAGTNPDWGSTVIDQAAEAWPAFYVERVVRPLWAAGYRGFFLDTLDSWRLVADSDTAAASQRAGLVRVIRAIRSAFPDARLFLNRGFEILPEIHAAVVGVAAESLYRGWDPREKRFRAVDPAERTALLAALEAVRRDYGLPIVAIDYLPPEDRALARTTAARISDHGFIPWISTPAMDMLGVGAIEVMPRRILVIHDAGTTAHDLDRAPAARYAAMPINHLGYVPEYASVAAGPLPSQPLAGRYAGIVMWLTATDEAHADRLAPFLARAMKEGVRIAVFGRFGLAPGRATDTVFGTTSRTASDSARLEERLRDRRVGFEIAPLPDRRDFFQLAATGGNPWLTYTNERGQTMDAIAITPWGGYALSPYDVLVLPGGRGARWVVDPFAFLEAALALPAIPVPDTTTTAGRRLLLVHFDDTGYETRSEVLLETERPPGRGGPPAFAAAGALIAGGFIERHAIPTSISGPLAPSTLFALPHVERIGRNHLIEREGSDLLTRENASVTAVPPLGLPAEGTFRLFAPVPGDAAYTNGWSGPHFGYERVLETFALAGSPRRLTPVHIRYQAYAGVRRTSLAALGKVYRWALGADLHPVFVSEYEAMVMDFNRTVIARTPTGWRTRNAGALRTLRSPVSSGIPDLTTSRGVGSFHRVGEAIYIHLTASDTLVHLAAPNTGTP